jgi:clan AA aspartic protease (TIGR02281 family)
MKHKLFIEQRKIIVSAQIKGNNDTMDFKFILDTGSSKTIISEQTAISLGFDLKGLKTGDRLMTAGGGMHSKTLKLPKINLFDKDMSDFEVNVLNLPLQITYFADGLIGLDFLLQFKNIKFDFDEKTIET